MVVVNFAAGGVATPADAALMMQLGSFNEFINKAWMVCLLDLVFLNQETQLNELQYDWINLKAIVRAVTHYNDPEVLAEVSTGLGEAMVGINCDTLLPEQKFATRGW